jgi:hypothetical protein
MRVAGGAHQIRSSSSTSARRNMHASLCCLGLIAAVLACGSTTASPPTRNQPTSPPSAGTAGEQAQGGGGGSAATNTGGKPARGSSSGVGEETSGGADNPDEPGGACPELMDPQQHCPTQPSPPGAPCTDVAICDYDICGQGCFDMLICEESGGDWTGALTLCGGSCHPPEAEADPWQRTRTVTFAELSGSCGKLGALEMDPVANTLGALSCTVASDERNGCVFHRALDCSLDGVTLGLDLRVTFRRGRGFRGEAKVTTGGSASSCTSDYLVAL